MSSAAVWASDQVAGVLLHVLYAHALVAAPGLALGWLAPIAPLLGDPPGPPPAPRRTLT